jgi:hypothetical protein
MREKPMHHPEIELSTFEVAFEVLQPKFHFAFENYVIKKVSHEISSTNAKCSSGFGIPKDTRNQNFGNPAESPFTIGCHTSLVLLMVISAPVAYSATRQKFKYIKTMIASLEQRMICPK